MTGNYSSPPIYKTLVKAEEWKEGGEDGDDQKSGSQI